MFRKIHKRMKGEKGFTLIELLVVIIIIAILAAIAIPTFLGQRQKAQDAAAKSIVRNAMTAVESAYVDAHTYAPATVTPTVLNAIEPSFTFVDGHTAHVATLTAFPVSTTALASAQDVDYWGDPSTYSIGTVSESGNKFGVYTNKGASGSTTFVKIIGTTFSTGW